MALSARRADRLAALVERIAAAGGDAVSLPGDMAVEAEAIGAVEEAIARLGRIDILVNAAGMIQAGGVESLPTEEWRRVIDINLMGTLYACKAALGHMKRQGGGASSTSRPPQGGARPGCSAPIRPASSA